MANNIIHTTTANTAANDGDLKAPLAPPMNKGDPPSEWASSTLDAMGPGTSEPHPSNEPLIGKTGSAAANEEPTNTSSTAAPSTYPSSTATTPGLQVPGAFPHVHSKALPQETQNSKDAAVNALDSARGYIVSAGETVGALLPQSMAAYLPRSQSQHTNKVDSEVPEPNNKFSQTSDDKSCDASTSFFPSVPAGNALSSHPKSNSETMRDGGEDGPIDSMISPQSQRQDADVGASGNTSTRSLAGSRVDTLARATPGTSFTVSDSDSTEIGSSSGQDESSETTNITNTDGTINASSSSSAAAVDAANQRKAESQNGVDLENPDLGHHPDETRHMPSELDAAAAASTEMKRHAPDTISPTHHESPNTTAREYPIGTGDAKAFMHQNSGYSNVATPGHEAPTSVGDSKGKEENSAEVIEVAKTTGDASGTSASTTDAHPNSLTTSSGTENITAIDSATTGIGPTLSNPKDASENGAAKDLPTIPNEAPAGSKNASAPTTPPKKRKSAFMDKIRGEMKVLTGKLEHKQEKVEEGRRMISGQTTSKN